MPRRADLSIPYQHEPFMPGAKWFVDERMSLGKSGGVEMFGSISHDFPSQQEAQQFVDRATT